jgi:SNF2 family DNA or RNA helicase
MMNAVTESNNDAHPLLPNPPSGLPVETIMSLSEQARHLYDSMFDYCTYASDPQYQKLHKYRKRIAALDNARDRDVLIAYFNNDPAIKWKGIPEAPYIYYAKDYYNS